jgi:anti-sigma B factor antagonist
MKPENSGVMADAVPARATSAARLSRDKNLHLSLEAGHPGSAVVLHCQGRIVFRGEAQSLSTIVAEVLPSARRMVVDLSGVDSMDSGGLGELVLTYMWAEAAGYTLKFAGPKKAIRHLFETTNLESLFDIYASVPEAMAEMWQEEPPSA